MRKLGICLGVLLLLFSAAPAQAHKLKVFATAVGAQIEGSTYFVGGGPARGAAVVVQTAEGETLATLKADEEGKFAFSAASRIDQVIVVDTGDGHSARTTIAADDLPESLPPPAGSRAVAGEGAVAVSAAAGTPRPGDAVSPIPPVQAAVPLEDLVGQAVARQLRPLREQINDYEDQIRLRDIVGGVGWIIGIAGLTVGFRSRRRQGAGR